MNRSSVALTVVGLLVIVGLLVVAVANDTGEAVIIATGVALSGVLAAVISSRRRMNWSSVAPTVVGLLVIVGLLVLAVVNNTGEAALVAAGVALSGVLAAVISSRRHSPPRPGGHG
jgi:peptidoglycan/LPS O-acetylase OafA/YrhL